MCIRDRAWKQVYDWTGLYIGAHFGYGSGTSSATLTDPIVATNQNVHSGATAGVQAGYNWRLNSGLLFGVEGDISFPNYLPSNHSVNAAATVLSNAEESWDYFASMRGRIGYTSGNWLFYATGGFAWAYDQLTMTQLDNFGTTDLSLIHISEPTRPY